jgi:hypothetical protein
VILVRPFPTVITILILLAASALSAELLLPGAARDGGTLEYIFESDERDAPKERYKRESAEIAADFMTTFYGVQVGALETQPATHPRGGISL